MGLGDCEEGGSVFCYGRTGALMATRFRAYQPDQILLMPVKLKDWVPEGHLAHQVSDVVDKLALSAFYARYQGDGRRNAPYSPAMMVKVLIYGYATGVCSSRKIARKLEEDIAFRMLAAGNFPKHRTICEFRRRHLRHFQALFVKVVQLAREMGLVRFGTLSIDGTKVRANASKRKAMSYERLVGEEARLREEIEGLTTAAARADEEEDRRLGKEVRGDELPAELRRRADRLAAIEAARERLEAAQRRADDKRGRQPGQDRPAKGGRPYQREYGEPEPKAQSNFTDPQSRIMKTSTEGFQQSYNAQRAVDDAHQIVVGASVGAKANDVEQLLPMLDAVEETLGEKPQEVLADAGYCSEANLRELEKRDIDGYVALGREGKKQAAVDPAKRPATGRMKKRLETEAGRARYARRKWLSEAPNGWIKEVLGFRRFSFRGLAKVQAEWNLVCLAVNIKRIGALTTA